MHYFCVDKYVSSVGKKLEINNSLLVEPTYGTEIFDINFEGLLIHFK